MVKSCAKRWRRPSSSTASGARTPADYVGVFMTYRLACTNRNAAYGALQVGLEQIEAAYEFDAIDLCQLRAE